MSAVMPLRWNLMSLRRLPVTALLTTLPWGQESGTAGVGGVMMQMRSSGWRIMGCTMTQTMGVARWSLAGDYCTEWLPAAAAECVRIGGSAPVAVTHCCVGLHSLGCDMLLCCCLWGPGCGPCAIERLSVCYAGLHVFAELLWRRYVSNQGWGVRLGCMPTAGCRHT